MVSVGDDGGGVDIQAPGLKPACSTCLIQEPEGPCSLRLIQPSTQI
jgi:hypothetical protein